jgi:ABC-type proline/glycine betaine transport system permease subunit
MYFILYISITIGIILSVMNFYISFLVKYIEKNNKIGSGIPILGSLLLFISLFFIKNNLMFYTISLFALLDTGGIHWFIITILYYKIQNLGENLGSS